MVVCGSRPRALRAGALDQPSPVSDPARERLESSPPGVGLAGKGPAPLVEFLAAGLWTFYDGRVSVVRWLSWRWGQCASEEGVQVGRRRRDGLRWHRRERIRVAVGRRAWLARGAVALARFVHRLGCQIASESRVGGREREAGRRRVSRRHHTRPSCCKEGQARS